MADTNGHFPDDGWDTEDDIYKNNEQVGLYIPDGQFSSDGEFTNIANRQIAELGAEPLDLNNIKFEVQQGPEKITTSGGVTGVAVSEQWNLSNAATSKDPCTQNFAGELSFSVRVQPPVKSKDAQFSSKLNKLFINQNRAVNLWFKVRTDESVQLPLGLAIRAVAVYTRPDDFHLPVTVCVLHSMNSTGQLKGPNGDHLVRCTSEEYSYYFTDPDSKRHSVFSVLPEIQAGSNEVMLGYKFMDLGSCPGGLNRRDTAVIFTLELGGEVIGRHILPVRICTCPKRDMETEEKHERKNITTVQVPPPGKMKIEVEDKEFWVLARGSANFEALKKVGAILDGKCFGSDPRVYDETVNKHNGVVKTSSGKRKRVEECEFSDNGQDM